MATRLITAMAMVTRLIMGIATPPGMATATVAGALVPGLTADIETAYPERNWVGGLPRGLRRALAGASAGWPVGGERASEAGIAP
jgi:hypothetical protein